MLTSVRPVGNYFDYHQKPLNDNLFYPFKFKGYQSGTAALAAALILAKRRMPNVTEPEAIIPGYCCPDLLSACEFAGVKVNLVDLEPNSPRMSLSEIKSKVTSSTVAIIAVNFLGIPERIDEIRKTLEQPEILIIEDSAQGFPLEEKAEYWKGDIIILSFGRGKPLSLFGGGAVLFRDESMFDLLPKTPTPSYNSTKNISYRLKTLMYKALSTPALYYWLTKLSFLGLGRTVFKPLSALEALPVHIELLISNSLEQLKIKAPQLESISSQYKSIEGDSIIFLNETNYISQSCLLLRYPILIKNGEERKRLYQKLYTQGLGVSRMYKKAVLEIEGIPRSILIESPELPNAREFAEQLVTLPNHSGVNSKYIDKIKNVFSSET